MTESGLEIIFFIIFVIVALYIYFLPTIIASGRNSAATFLIFLVNLFGVAGAADDSGDHTRLTTDSTIDEPLCGGTQQTLELAISLYTGRILQIDGANWMIVVPTQVIGDVMHGGVWFKQ